MIKIRNLLPYAVGVPALDRVVEPDEVVEVADDDLAARMIQQVDNWDPVPKTERKSILQAAVDRGEVVAPEVAAPVTGDTADEQAPAADNNNDTEEAGHGSAE